MNPDIKQEWLDELPKHTQATGKLRTDDGSYCCLGVLCEVAARHNMGKWNYNHNSFKSVHPSHVSEHLVLPELIVQWSGLNDRTGSIEGYRDRCGERVSLSVLNDDGCTFNQIADVIRYFF